jgi:hypothetical protein
LTQSLLRGVLRMCRTFESSVAGVDMSENVRDRSKVNVNEASEVTYWCTKFGCSETQLRAAVKMVGVTVSKVRAHLAQRK